MPADEMTTRERFHAVMEFKPFDRLPVVEWATWWNLTIERWRKEGLPESCRDTESILRHFGLDLYLQDWPDAQKEGCPPLGESEDKYASIRPFLYPSPAVDLDLWRRRAKQQASGEASLWFTLDGFFWFPRKLMGIERHLLAFHEEPGLIHLINRDLAHWHLQVIEEICSVCVPDFMTFAEDMSYNHGPMLSKAHFDEFMRPYYDMVIPRLKEQGILPIVDSDGDITRASAWFAEAGIKGILPLERQAGVDATVVRAQNPRMRFIGCFDKMTMGRGEAAMRAEFERLLPLAISGGLVLSCDHQTPPNVSYSEYRQYLSLFREYSQKAGEASRRTG